MNFRKFRTPLEAFGGSILIAVMVAMLSRADAQIVPIPPCCENETIINQLAARSPGEQIDETTAWFLNQIRDDDIYKLISLEGALAGYCVRSCSPSFEAARKVLASIKERRLVEETKNEKWNDRVINIVGVIAGALIGAGATALFSRRRQA